MNTAVKKGNEVKIKTIIGNLERRNMKGYYCENMEEARKMVLSMIGDDDLVAWGGSVTIEELDLKPDLKKFLDRDMAAADDFLEVRRQALLSDVFLTSTNAITLDGELVNIDGMGNRVAAMCFGPNKVIVVAGANKIAENEEAAISRIKTEACPPNSIRLGKETPCAVTGKCADCLKPGATICSYTVTTRFCTIPDRIHVILVNENVGF